MHNLCPCGSGLTLIVCCEPIISGRKEAFTAQVLMRSRYVAFTQANIDYLMASHFSKTRPVKERKGIESWAKSVFWVGLTIINTEAGMANDEQGYVEFKATYMQDGKLQQIHEKSLFHRENQKWVYVSGFHL